MVELIIEVKKDDGGGGNCDIVSRWMVVDVVIEWCWNGVRDKGRR